VGPRGFSERASYRRPLRFEVLEERRMLATLTVNSLLDNVTGGDGLVTLREAIIAANTDSATDLGDAGGGADTIEFAASLTSGGPATLLLTQGQLVVTDSVTINGPGSDFLTLQAYDPTPDQKNGDGSRVFYISTGFGIDNVTISGLSLTGADRPTIGGEFSGGAITSVSANLFIDKCSITNNASSYGGGGVYTAFGNLTVTRTTISGNSAGTAGGGIVARSGYLNIVNSTISGNTTSNRGGGIYVRDENFTVTDSVISGNSSKDGGGIFVYFGQVSISACSISANSATRNGGGLYYLSYYSRASDVTISGTTIKGNSAGEAGGGICNAGNNGLFIDGSALVDNAAGAFGGGIYGGSDFIAVDHSIVTGNSAFAGGGIQSSGYVRVADSTVSENSATSNGGGIYGALVYVTNSTISDNSVDGLGGGIFGGSVSVRSSTVSGNSAQIGGGSYATYETSVTHSTVTSNEAHGAGGGTFSVVATTIDHSILAGNSALHGSDLTGLFGSAFVVRFSLIGTNANTGLAEAPVGSPDANGNLIGGTDFDDRIDPLLGALAANGGQTRTHALLTGSPAIDAGDPSFDVNDPDGNPLTIDSLLVDQRGAPFVRVFDDDDAGGARIDIGAYERQYVPGLDLVVDVVSDENNGDYSPGDLSLREAIGLANGSLGVDTVTFALELSSQTIKLGGAELEITDELTIDALALTSNLTIDADQQSRIFNITAVTGGFTLAGLTLTGGMTTSEGGAVRSLTVGNLTIAESIISGNVSNHYGGGIYASGAVTLIQSTVSGNSAISNYAMGGGIYATSVTLTQSTISDNSASAGAGGIYSSGAATFIQSTVSGNYTTRDFSRGGGIKVDGPVVLIHSTFTNNRAMGFSMGGGIFQSNASSNYPFTIVGSIVANNTAGNGGADLVKDPQSVLTVNYSLIGTGVVPNAGGNNFITDLPQLAPLADNGGPTMTHALLVGSPAIDAGDPSFDPDDPDGDPMTDDGVPFDQRGAPFNRVFDGDGMNGAQIDIGAFELIPDDAVHALFGDYNQNGVADAADYTVWRNTLGQTGIVQYSGADGSGNGSIGPEDYGVWKLHFGETIPQGAGSGEQGVRVATALADFGELSRAEPVAHVAEDPRPIDNSRSLPEGEAINAALAARVAPSLYDGTALLAANILSSRSSADFGELPSTGSGSELVEDSRAVASPSRGRVASVVRDSPHDDALVAWLSVSRDRGRDRFEGTIEQTVDGTGVASGTHADHSRLNGHYLASDGLLDYGLPEYVDAIFASVGGDL
jgi:predicted outer membrane repeat protein